MRLILASASPRRRELLRMLVPAFECEAADIDEAMLRDEPPADYVCRMSSEKAARVWALGNVVIGADIALVSHAATSFRLRRVIGCKNKYVTLDIQGSCSLKCHRQISSIARGRCRAGETHGIASREPLTQTGRHPEIT